VIYVLPAEAVLDGGIELAPGQRLLGAGGAAGHPDATRPRLTNSTDRLDGAIVTLSRGNEVAGLHFVDTRTDAIRGDGENLSGTYIHHSEFSGATVEGEALAWSIRLVTGSGYADAVRVTDSYFHDGHDLSGIQIHQRGESSGSYLFERNRFSDLGGRAYHLMSEDASEIRAEVLSSTVDNIGLGNRNSDSILPHLRDRSRQTVIVRDFHYRNTKRVGSPSNCGLEAFFEGEPFPARENWCDGCSLTLRIWDSVFENPVTDGIQLINFGSNSVLDAEIRGTRILDAKPQQVGGGISLLSQNAQNTGNRSRLLVENSDVIGSAAFGIAISDAGEGYTSVVDLGGGALGSKGHNRIVGSAQGELRVIQADPVARHNWWGGEAPRIELEGDRSSFDEEPTLDIDPR
jgi:hypothetical protein